MTSNAVPDSTKSIILYALHVTGRSHVHTCRTSTPPTTHTVNGSSNNVVRFAPQPNTAHTRCHGHDTIAVRQRYWCAAQHLQQHLQMFEHEHPRASRIHASNTSSTMSAASDSMIRPWLMMILLNPHSEIRRWVRATAAVSSVYHRCSGLAKYLCLGMDHTKQQASKHPMLPMELSCIDSSMSHVINVWDGL